MCFIFNHRVSGNLLLDGLVQRLWRRLWERQTRMGTFEARPLGPSIIGSYESLQNERSRPSTQEHRHTNVHTYSAFSKVHPQNQNQIWWTPNSLSERPTSPRIVTSKQHSKHTWMRPIVLSIHSFITTHLLPYCPPSMVESSQKRPFTRRSLKRPREQYLGSLKESLNKTKICHRSSTTPLQIRSRPDTNT